MLAIARKRDTSEMIYLLIDLEGRTVVPDGVTLAAGNPVNFNVMVEERTVETWREGVRNPVQP